MGLAAANVASRKIEMSAKKPVLNSEDFVRFVDEGFRFLEEKGFQRLNTDEDASSTGATAVYLGQNVGFIFSFDFRDQSVDGRVVRVHEGRMRQEREGGYSEGIFMHLVTREGYRGGLPLPELSESQGEHPMKDAIERWANLLKRAGQKLMSDQPNSLPQY